MVFLLIFGSLFFNDSFLLTKLVKVFNFSSTLDFLFKSLCNSILCFSFIIFSFFSISSNKLAFSNFKFLYEFFEISLSSINNLINFSDSEKLVDFDFSNKILFSFFQKF